MHNSGHAKSSGVHGAYLFFHTLSTIREIVQGRRGAVALRALNVLTERARELHRTLTVLLGRKIEVGNQTSGD